MSLLDGVKYLSFSSIALFKNAPSVWCMEKLYGVRGESGPAAWRGTAIEAGVDLGVMRTAATDEECLEVAMQNFDLNSGGLADDATEKERENIKPILLQALAIFRPHGMPLARQLRIEYRLDDVPIPIIGYVDYSYPEHLRDLKTTLRMPSEPRPDHAMQVAGYSRATGKKASLVYVTPKKSAEYLVEDIDDRLADLGRAARSLCHALSRFENPQDMARCYAPSFDSFYWSPETKTKALEIYA